MGEDSTIRFTFDETDILGNPIDRIMVNGKPLKQLISELVESKSDIAAPDKVREFISTYHPNPLWGKKLVAVGDSLITRPLPAESTSYPAFIAKRNNMTLVHKGVRGKKLCNDQSATNPSLISCYTNDIPSDADYILCQIGANDVDDWWARNNALAEPVSDEDMSLNTFKGCWNNLLLGLKKNYPNAKIGIVLANNWCDNLGVKSRYAITNNLKRAMTQWQKVQCQKFNIPVLDPQEDIPHFTWNLKIYPSETQVPIENLELDWYDQMKIQMGTS